jgi:hypothetical protein
MLEASDNIGCFYVSLSLPTPYWESDWFPLYWKNSVIYSPREVHASSCLRETFVQEELVAPTLGFVGSA